MVFYHNIDPVLVHLGPLQIRWYGVMYVLGFLFVYWYVKKRSRENKLRMSEDQIDTFMAWLTIGLLLGARLFDIIFWNASYYLQHPLQMLAVWNGGLSFHGGLVGVFVAAILLCKKYNLHFLDVADAFIVPLALAQAFGRIGNFINGELYGIPTALSWGVNFFNEHDLLGNLVFRHPNQLYEVAYNVIIFGILWFLKDKKLSKGFLFGLFLALYGMFRFLTEFVRVPDVMIGSLTVPQALNIPMVIVGVWLLTRKK